jgi:hypothetical protein
MARLIADGLPAGEAATKAKAEAPIETTALIVRETTNRIAEEKDDLRARLQSFEQAMLNMAETFKTEVSGLRVEISRLTESNRTLQLRLEPPPLPAAFHEPPKKTLAWSPPKVKDPAEGMGFLHRVWVEFTQPEQLRRSADN